MSKIIERIVKNIDTDRVRCIQFGWDDGDVKDILKKTKMYSLVILNGAVEFNEEGARAYVVDTRLAIIKGEFDLAVIDANEPWTMMNIYRSMEHLVDGGLVHLYNLTPAFTILAWELCREGTLSNDAYMSCRDRKVVTLSYAEGKLWSHKD